ncbi:MAG: hypothetical protein M3401_08990 [Actinomycetota bacterium]|nr:hypothetical protein [Actinomycetota bacterium]
MTRLLRSSLIAFAALLALAIGASTALASGQDVIRDCTDDEVLSKAYTQKEYKDALAQLSSDSDQYGNCLDVIKRAQLKASRDARARRNDTTNAGGGRSGGGAPAGGTGGGFGNPPAAKQLDSATTDERAAVETGRKSALTPVNVQGAAVKPGIGSASDLPAPLLILLALVLAGALALAAIRIRALVLARRA